MTLVYLAIVDDVTQSVERQIRFITFKNKQLKQSYLVCCADIQVSKVLTHIVHIDCLIN